MKIWGVSRIGLDFALAMGSAKFGGNVRFKEEPRRWSGRGWTLTLRHREPGAGSMIYNHRTGPAVCWHAHGEFMRAVFQINPKAKIITAFATYRCREDLEARIEYAPDDDLHDFQRGWSRGRCNCTWE